jgi:hypothetical protein
LRILDVTILDPEAKTSGRGEMAVDDGRFIAEPTGQGDDADGSGA